MKDSPAVPTSLYDRALATAGFLRSYLPEVPHVAMILGSGLGDLADDVQGGHRIPYHEIPGFPVSRVEGHSGQLVTGTFQGRPVVMMQGRVHYYEGWELDDVTFPIRVFALLGIKTLLVTNSAGGANPEYTPGDLMVIRDHINLTGVNPLRGANEDRFGLRFPDMSDPYARELREVMHRAAAQLGIRLQEGVYAGVAGPSYETPSEVRMIQRLGGDAVGMSTVPEVIVARHSGMRVAGISCITNPAAGLNTEPLTHEEVKETAQRVRGTFGALVRTITELLP